jgi:galactitol-specific phosphotransferase system IIC component
MLKTGSTKPPSEGCLGPLAGILLTLLVLCGIFGAIFAGVENSSKIDSALQNEHEVEMAKIPETLEERQVDAMKDITIAGYQSNVAIAGTGFGAVASITWAHTFQVIGIALALIAVAVIVIVVTSKRNTPNAGSYHEPAGIPVDIPTYQRTERK